MCVTLVYVFQKQKWAKLLMSLICSNVPPRRGLEVKHESNYFLSFCQMVHFPKNNFPQIYLISVQCISKQGSHNTPLHLADELTEHLINALGPLRTEMTGHPYCVLSVYVFNHLQSIPICGCEL